ncbi:DUF6301 family protein [Nocardia pseudobrasiliensis]|uniref:Uncharacterized protein n=1 Tax=Nocardia pseudobrasiliensis TaxID=45979 RepID=A0A370I8L7_9NOCA|nr:DUF6301 family protein [Nocardia pseudobrasiliensis]RDI65734.1 hypothetical protein DFR76_10549 [Nocardia pseudobrasiliensis]
MRADLDRAIQVIQGALEFNWAWTVDDLPEFVRQVGWQLANLDQRSPTLTTDFDINRTDVMAFHDNSVDPARPTKRIWIYFTDVILDDANVKPLLSNAFDELAQRIFQLVGQRPLVGGGKIRIGCCVETCPDSC